MKPKKVTVSFLPPKWTAFQRGVLNETQLKQLADLGVAPPDEVHLNSRYEVWVRNLNAAGAKSLSVKRRDKSILRDWRDLQRIKNEICGEEIEACELFPAESRLVDTANQYWLWCLAPGDRFPFGFKERAVSDSEADEIRDDGSRQRPLEEG